jgi:hypothetical protein
LQSTWAATSPTLAGDPTTPAGVPLPRAIQHQASLLTHARSELKTLLNCSERPSLAFARRQVFPGLGSALVWSSRSRPPLASLFSRSPAPGPGGALAWSSRSRPLPCWTAYISSSDDLERPIQILRRF